MCELPGQFFEADGCDEECPGKQRKFSWYHGFGFLWREEDSGFGGKHVENSVLITELVPQVCVGKPSFISCFRKGLPILEEHS